MKLDAIVVCEIDSKRRRRSKVLRVLLIENELLSCKSRQKLKKAFFPKHLFLWFFLTWSAWQPTVDYSLFVLFWLSTSRPRHATWPQC